MKLSIIIIGDEILLGRVADTNSGTIARAFTGAGWDVASVRTVGDDGAAIGQAVRAALAEADLVVTTGGLGPTRDDITKSVLMDIFGGSLHQDADVLANVEAVFARRGIAMNELTRAQALVPTSCSVIQNRLGTAPIMWFEGAAGVLAAMPGVPFETRGMLPEVVEAAKRRFHPHGHFRRSEYTVGGIAESALAEHLAQFEDSLPPELHLAYLPGGGRILLRLDGRDCTDQVYQRYKTGLEALINRWLVGMGDLSLAAVVLERLRGLGATMATAESCTGGNIAHVLTAVAGASDVVRGGIVAYANGVKSAVLGVDAAVIESCGAVSEPVVRAMAEGARRVCGADYAVATSGIAGPGGGTPAKPVGTVWIAASGPAVTEAKVFNVPGDRAAVIEGATARALNMLLAIIPQQ